MTKRKRPNFTPEFRLECAQLIVDKGYGSLDDGLAQQFTIIKPLKGAMQLNVTVRYSKYTAAATSIGQSTQEALNLKRLMH